MFLKNLHNYSKRNPVPSFTHLFLSELNFVENCGLLYCIKQNFITCLKVFMLPNYSNFEG